MKKLVRKNVFETNSSSSHSISLAGDAKDFVLDTIYPDQNGKIELIGGEFGWEWFKHNDAITKANYAAVDFQGIDSLEDMLKDVLMEHTGAEEIVFKFSDDYEDANWSYIDHDSAGTAPRTKEELKDFIFNKNSWLFGGNDNTQPHPEFYDVPTLTKEGRQVVVEYTHQLNIDGYSKTAKFKSKPTKEEVLDALDSILSDVCLTSSGYFDDNTDIMHRIMRNESVMFKYESWKKPIDFKRRKIFFIKDAWSTARNRWEWHGKNKDWEKGGYAETRDIEKSLYDDEESGFVKVIKFSINKLS